MKSAFAVGTCAAGLAVASVAYAQDAPFEVGDQYRFLRWAENYSDLGGVPLSDRSGLERIKNVPLWAGGPSLTIGGDYRLRLEGFADPGFALRGSDDFVSTNHRFLLHANLAIAERVRLFGELGWFVEDGRKPSARPFDESDLDLQQLFVDVGSPSDAMLRVGRQEMLLGSTRLFGLREGPNIRRVFDAAKLDFVWDDVKFTGFYARPVINNVASFDNASTSAEQTWGGLATYALPTSAPNDGLSIEPYYFGRSLDVQRWGAEVADERRHTLGVRSFGTLDRFDYDVEAAYQFGRFGEQDVRAWGVATLFGYTFADTAWTPRIGVRANAASGDTDASDGRLQTFDALYPNLSYFTDAAVYAPANAVDVRPFVELEPNDVLSLSFGADAIFRLHESDAVFGAGYIPLVPGGTGGKGLTTVLVDASATWRVSPFVEAKVSYVHGFAGPVVKRAGGQDFDFGLLQLTTRF